MATTPFDTLKAFKSLQEAGFDEAQAEAVIATIGNAIGGNMATKDDISEVTSIGSKPFRHVFDSVTPDAILGSEVVLWEGNPWYGKFTESI